MGSPVFARSSSMVGALVLGALVASAHAGTMPELINFQGKLTSPEGQPVDAGQYTIEFRIYDQATAGTMKWGPQTIENVPVIHGQFNVLLGPEDDATDSLMDALGTGVCYVETTIQGGPALTPRQQLLSTPYALVAGDAVPVGSILPWIPPAKEEEFSSLTIETAEALLPSNYKICDGADATDDSRTVFDETKIPDLSDRFIAGVTVDESGNIAEDELGESMLGQVDGENTHHHTFSGNTGTSTDPVGGVSNENSAADAAKEGHTHSASGTTGQQSNVPPNMKVMFIIRVN